VPLAHTCARAVPMPPPRSRILSLLLLLYVHGIDALDVPDPGDGLHGVSPATQQPSSLLRGVQNVLYPPIKLFREAPPITRSWVSGSIAVAIASSQRWVDLRSLCFSERAVLYDGEWWRLLTNFFFMGEAVKSIFFWMQIYHFWECLKVLELVKYRWEPGDFVKMIICSAVMLLGLKQLFPALIFLGSPMVMVFIYIYARTYETQAMNFLGFFQIQCGWLPFTQMLQDYAQTGDIGPNLLGLVAGHVYFYLTEVASRVVLPESLDELLHPPAKVVEGAEAGAEEGMEAGAAEAEGAEGEAAAEAEAASVTIGDAAADVTSDEEPNEEGSEVGGEEAASASD